jgi:hypothetical protein
MAALLPTTEQLAEAIAATARDDAASLPLLDGAGRALLLSACAGLSYRAARPLVGAAGQEVRQDFELSMAIGSDDPLRQLALALTSATNAALALLPAALLPDGIDFNDLIVQRYQAGSAGITPHRDHIRYGGLVALVTLEGSADLLLCADRAGSNPRAFPMAPGGLTLMRAPGLDGRGERPFHCVAPLREPRVSIGLRHDTQAAG